MNLLRGLFLGFTLACSATTAMATPAQVVRLNADEAFLGDITYQGGLLYRGQLNFPLPTEINTFRLEVPTYCKAAPFEVGFIINNMYESAEVVDAKNYIYKSRSGQPVLANGVYISLNGEQAGNCHVLVFKVTSNGPVDPMPSDSYVSCVSNMLPNTLIFSAQAGASAQNITMAPFETIALVTRVQVGIPVIKKVTVSFDQNLGFDYEPISYQLDGVLKRGSDCVGAPFYDFRQAGLNRINLFKRP